MLQPNPYDVLFEEVQIGPVTAPNRFYQVPHACGMGHLRPQAHAAMREVKALGGWGVVCTEETEIHPSSDLSPYSEQRLWDERDIPALSLMVEAVKRHGALVGIELVHNGHMASNLFSRLPALAPADIQLDDGYPRMARRMDKSDIRELRRWHRRAARNAKAAGFDIIYVYAGHDMAVPQHFLLPRYNQRSDEYGGSLENRARLIRELLSETKDEVGDRCAVALRLGLDERMGADGMQAHEEGRAVVELLADIPDLWDVNVSNWQNDTVSTRFEPDEGYEVDQMRFVREVTGKPTVGVGRFTSPDLMVRLVRGGVLDLIGAARPSIADPYLPNKIAEGRTDAIRECIGCNICASSDKLGVPIRCTQNPTMGEEWRRGWHPESIAQRASDAEVLVVGAGPAGLECALQLGRRGYRVSVAEATGEFGGRSLRESGLKGLTAWRRVADNRLYELSQMANVRLYRESPMSAGDIVETESAAVFLATGARWRGDGTGRTHFRPVQGLSDIAVFTPDDVMAGNLPVGPVVIYDDDQGYMGGVIADHLAGKSLAVTFVTTASIVSPFTTLTLEQHRIQSSLIAAGVKLVLSSKLVAAGRGTVSTADIYGGSRDEIACTGLVLVTARDIDRSLSAALKREAPDLCVETIGDALAPGLIADATFSGHLAARNFESDVLETEAAIYRREMPALPAVNTL